MSSEAFSVIEMVDVDRFSLLLTELENFGWVLNDHGRITYLPLGDSDFSWVSAPLTELPIVLGQINEKLSLGECVGIVMTYKGSGSGGKFLYEPNKRRLSISWVVNRKNSPTGSIDFEWYIEKLVPAIRRTLPNCLINSFERDSGGTTLIERGD